MCHCAGLMAIGQVKKMDRQTQAQLAKLAPIFDALGEMAVDLTVLGSGAQASVWRIRTDRADYALRVLKPGAPGLNPAIDARLRKALVERGAAVVRPVLTSDDVATPEVAAQWVLDDFVDGRPLSGALTMQQADDLGRPFGYRTVSIMTDGQIFLPACRCLCLFLAMEMVVSEGGEIWISTKDCCAVH